MIPDSSMIGRPDFIDPGDYLADVADHLGQGRRPWPPVTVGELLALLGRYPSIAREHWPAPAIARQYGLPINPFSPRCFRPEWRCGLVATLQADEQFRRAVRAVIGGAA